MNSIGAASDFNKLYERLGMSNRGVAGEPFLGHLNAALFEIIRRIEVLESHEYARNPDKG